MYIHMCGLIYATNITLNALRVAYINNINFNFRTRRNHDKTSQEEQRKFNVKNPTDVGDALLGFLNTHPNDVDIFKIHAVKIIIRW